MHLEKLLDHLAAEAKKRKGNDLPSPDNTTTQQTKRARSHFPYKALKSLNPLHVCYWDSLACCAVLAACANSTDKFNCVLCGNPESSVSSYNYYSHLKDGTCKAKTDGAGNNIMGTPPAPLTTIVAIPERALNNFRLLSPSQRQDLLDKHLPGELLAPVREALHTAFASLPVQVAEAPPSPATSLAANTQQQHQQDETFVSSVLNPDPTCLAVALLPNTLIGSAANFRKDSESTAGT
jgi:hypothetical protein